MDVQYFVVFTDAKKGEAVANAVTASIAAGAVVISATGTKDAVHYVLGSVPTMLPEIFPEDEEEIQIALDNIDAKEKVTKSSE